VNSPTIGTLADLDDLPDATEVVVRRQNPAVLLAGLVVVGVLAALMVVFVVSSLTGVVAAGRDGAPSLTLAEVQTSSNIVFPAGSEVLAASDASGVFTAEVLLPGAALPDFAQAGYAETDAPSQALAAAVEGRPVVQSYAASSAAWQGSAVLVDRDGARVLLVDVRAAD
jgi:hypothetical protein